MKNQAFTLIEILVVVLIIGILAAVALPQYQKAVVKSRYNTMKNMAKSIAQAEEAYYLRENAYTINEEDLDLKIPPYNSKYCSSDNCQYYYDWGIMYLVYRTSNESWKKRADIIMANETSTNMKYVQGFSEYGAYQNQRICVASGPNRKPIPKDANYQVCEQETGDSNPLNWGTYSLAWTYQN